MSGSLRESEDGYGDFMPKDFISEKDLVDEVSSSSDRDLGQGGTSEAKGNLQEHNGLFPTNASQSGESVPSYNVPLNKGDETEAFRDADWQRELYRMMLLSALVMAGLFALAGAFIPGVLVALSLVASPGPSWILLLGTGVLLGLEIALIAAAQTLSSFATKQSEISEDPADAFKSRRILYSRLAIGLGLILGGLALPLFAATLLPGLLASLAAAAVVPLLPWLILAVGGILTAAVILFVIVALLDVSKLTPNFTREFFGSLLAPDAAISLDNNPDRHSAGLLFPSNRDREKKVEQLIKQAIIVEMGEVKNSPNDPNARADDFTKALGAIETALKKNNQEYAEIKKEILNSLTPGQRLLVMDLALRDAEGKHILCTDIRNKHASDKAEQVFTLQTQEGGLFNLFLLYEKYCASNFRVTNTDGQIVNGDYRFDLYHLLVSNMLPLAGSEKNRSSPYSLFFATAESFTWRENESKRPLHNLG